MPKVTRYLLAAALALGLVAPAWATDSFPTARVPKSRRVLFVNDAEITSFGASPEKNAQRIRKTYWGGLISALERQGAQVDIYPSTFFTKSTNVTAANVATLWKNAGDTYSLAIFANAVQYGTATAGASNRTRFMNADSTNVQIMVLWASNSRNEPMGADTTSGAYYWPLANFPHRLSTSANSLIGATTAYGNRTALRAYGTTDTLWIPVVGTGWMRLPYKLRLNGNTVDTSKVVRTVETFDISGGTLSPYYSNADSTSTYYGALGDSTASADSSAAGTYRELLGPAWKVYFDSGRWVDHLVSYPGTSPTYTSNFSMLAYAIAARYLDLRPIRVAVEMDDVFDMNPNNTGTRWSNAAYDSLFTKWVGTYNCKPLADVNPTHGYEYMRGDDPTYETAWSGAAWTWPRKWRNPWVHHSHDAVASRATSNLVGGFGGYATGNANVVTIGGVNTFIKSPRFAFRLTPGDTVYGASIYHRLRYSDSLRAAVCPECPLPPYLSFPNNEVLPVNWRVRTAPTGWARYRSVSSDSLCTIDSTFLAMARGLKIPSGGTLYLRGTLSAGSGDAGYLTFRPWGTQSPRNAYTGNEDLYTADSVVAKTPFINPGDERIVRDRYGVTDPTGATSGTAYWIKVKNVATVTFDPGSSNQPITQLMSAAPVTLARLLGFWNGTVTATSMGTVDANGNVYGEAFSLDPASVYGTGNDQQNSGRDRPRVVYLHPGNYAGVSTNPPIGPGDNYATSQFARFILQPVKALNNIAGKRIIQWVYPWETYQP